MRLDADPQRDAQVDGLFIGETELFTELMDPDLCCHVRDGPFVGETSAKPQWMNRVKRTL
jgi:hypothetical protein